MRKILLNIGLLIIISMNGYSNDIIKEFFYHENGLANEAISSIVNDSIGFIWVVTNKSIIKLAGNELIYVDSKLEGGESYRQLINTKKYGVLAVSDSNIYRILKGNRTNSDYYIKPLLEDIEIEKIDDIKLPKAIYQSKRDSNIWISTEGGGIYKLTESKLLTVCKPDHIENDEVPFFYNVFEIGSMFFAISSTGNMYSIHLGKLIPVNCDYDIKRIYTVMISAEGIVYVGADNKLFSLIYKPNLNSFSVKVIHSGISVTVIKEISKNELVLGTSEFGVYTIKLSNSGSELTKLEGIGLDGVFSLLCDKSKMWVGTNSGLSLYKCVPFKVIPYSYANALIRDVEVGKDGDAYIAEDIKVLEYDVNTEKIKELFVSKRGKIICFAIDEDRLIASTIKGWILIYNFASSKVEEIYSGSEKHIYDLAIDNNGNIWFAQHADTWRLMTINNGEVIDIKGRQGLNVEVHSLTVSKNGDIYFGSNGANTYLYKYDFETGIFNNISKGIERFEKEKNFIVYDEYVVSESSIYLATSNGVWHLLNDNISKINIGIHTDEGSFGLDIDKKGVLWIATNKGLVRYKNKVYNEFNEIDGLPTRKLTHRSIVHDDDNNVWVATRKGIVVGNINDDILKPEKGYIKSIEVSGESQDVYSESIIRSDKIINVEIYSPNYPDRYSIYSYSFSKDNIDNWEELRSGNTKLVFSNLKKGKYVLKIRTRHSGSSDWSDITEHKVNIYAPWYMRFEVMLVISGFLLLFLIFIGVSYRNRSKRHMHKLELIIESRTEELQRQNGELIKLNNNLNKANKKIENDIISKEKMFSILAHDLRSPFNVLIGISEILKDERDTLSTDTLEKLVLELYMTSTSTFKLLENLLDWTRSQTGRIKVNPTKVNLLDVTKEVLETIKVIADHKGIVIVCSIDRELSVVVDPAMLGAIIRNLTANAIKFSYSQSVVKVEAHGNGEMVHFKVVDQGIGIEPERLVKMFDLGGAESTRGTAHEKGTGLGLLVCNEFAKRNNGKITVESKQGKGSVFTLLLPKA